MNFFFPKYTSTGIIGKMSNIKERKRILHIFKIYAIKLNQLRNNASNRNIVKLNKIDYYLDEFDNLIKKKMDKQFVKLIFEMCEDIMQITSLPPPNTLLDNIFEALFGIQTYPEVFDVKDMIVLTDHYHWYINQ